MTIQFNHTVLYAHDSEASAKFLAEMLGLPAPARWGPFVVVKTDNGTNLDYMDTDVKLRANTTPSWSTSRISMRSSNEFAHGSSPTGPIPAKRSRAKSIIMMVGAVSTLRIRTGISSKLLPVPMAAAAGNPERLRNRRLHSDLAISSVIFFASPSTIMVLSR
jgi:hypothetical protein